MIMGFPLSGDRCPEAVPKDSESCFVRSCGRPCRTCDLTNNFPTGCAINKFPFGQVTPPLKRSQDLTEQWRKLKGISSLLMNNVQNSPCKADLIAIHFIQIGKVW
jgi:hypothetical protein